MTCSGNEHRSLRVRPKKNSSTGLVQETAARLREMILGHEPYSLIGSLRQLTEKLGVGIVTLQQASRILEHEGLLEVRRGPGGGYFGTRPDAAALGRSISRFLLAHASDQHEAIDIVSLLDCELLACGASGGNDALRKELRRLGEAIDACDAPEQRVMFENKFHDILFRMVNRPLTELLARVTMRLYTDQMHYTFYSGPDGVTAWKTQRRDIVHAILKRDPDLAKFEGLRRRTYLMRQLNSR
jgi:GntR family transcriptional repressor for pyruvate dehydrogenase complex